jgi:hypothetical protein
MGGMMRINLGRTCTSPQVYFRILRPHAIDAVFGVGEGLKASESDLFLTLEANPEATLFDACERARNQCQLCPLTANEVNFLVMIPIAADKVSGMICIDRTFIGLARAKLLAENVFMTYDDRLKFRFSCIEYGFELFDLILIHFNFSLPDSGAIQL